VDVLSARVVLLLEPLLALLPAQRVHRRFDVQQVSRSWVEADDIQFTLIAASLSLTDRPARFGAESTLGIRTILRAVALEALDRLAARQLTPTMSMTRLQRKWPAGSVGEPNEMR
jgi:hypothetical protein